MMTYVSIVAAVLLFGIMAIHVLRTKYENSLPDIHNSGDRDGVFAQEAEGAEQVLQRVFSSEDEEFIAGLASVDLQKLLAQERKKLALRWLTRRTVEARQIMREHARAARTSRDLQASGEVQLFVRYAELRALCGLLFVLVIAVGPSGLSRLAMQTDTLFVRMRSGKPAAKLGAA